MTRLAITRLAAVLALAVCVASQAPAPAPGPPSSAAADCGAAVNSLIMCAPYVGVQSGGGSAQSKPPKACCDGVKSAVASPAAVQCLCEALGKNYGVQLNMTRAVGLPVACGADPAAFSKCNIKLPGAPPTGAPAPTSGSTPAASSPGESKSSATRSPISAVAVVAAVAAPLLSYYYL